MVFIILWFVQQISNYVRLFNPPATYINGDLERPTGHPHDSLAKFLGLKTVKSEDNSTVDNFYDTIQTFSSAMIFTAGIALTAVRFYEPLFRYYFIK